MGTLATEYLRKMQDFPTRDEVEKERDAAIEKVKANNVPAEIKIPVKTGNVAEKKLVEDAKDSLKKKISNLEVKIEYGKDQLSKQRDAAEKAEGSKKEAEKKQVAVISKRVKEIEGQLAKAKAKLSSLNK